MHTDLDSIASAIGYAYFAGHSNTTACDASKRYVALYHAPKQDLQLRPENLFVLKQSRVDPDEHILWLDDLPSDLPSLAGRGLCFALVDHNRLAAKFAAPDESVVGIIDHHDDEGHHLAARPRKIQVPTGSCSSLVTENFVKNNEGQSFPTELADLLVGAIMIDTGNVKAAPKGKAVASDVEVFKILWPFTTLGGSQAQSLSTQSTGVDLKSVRQQTEHVWQQIADKKYDLSSVGHRDLLRRDYKEYETELMGLRYGLSSVPMALSEWLSRPDVTGNLQVILDFMEAWGAERKLDIVGVLTSYVGQSSSGGDKPTKGREHVYLLRSHDAKRTSVLQSAFTHYERTSTDVLNLQPLQDVVGTAIPAHDNGLVKTYQQLLVKATRKQVAPALKAALEAAERDYQAR